jgi:type IX secretion system PorP/SprF family membrane protein
LGIFKTEQMTGSMKKYILLALFAPVMFTGKAQQTIQLSQYMFNGLALNPAYAGYKEDLTLNLSERIQWVGINDAPQTSSLSIDGLASQDNKNVGLGLITTLDQLGPESSVSAYANYAYRLRLDALDTKRLCFGIGAGFLQYSLDGSKFSADDADDASIPSGTISKITPDVRFGIYYYSPTVYFGASAFNLLSGAFNNIIDDPEIIEPVRTFYVTGGGMIALSDDVDLKPSFMIQEDFKGPTNIDLTSYLAFNRAIWFGASYRMGVSVWNSNLQGNLEGQDAVSSIVQYYVNENFRVGYAYDFTVSKLAGYQNGTHELSISITFPNKKQRIISPRYF